MQIDLVYLAAAIAALSALYYWISQINGYFRDQPIPSMAAIPIFGSTWPLVFRRVPFVDFLHDIYYKYAGSKVFGMFELTRPVYVIRDPELLKQITIKDFDHFVDRPPLVATDDHLLISKALSSLTGQHWRHVRHTLSPSFTGAKMRQLFELIRECSEDMVGYCLRDDHREYDVKDVFSRFTNDAIATCAFGLKVDSLRHPENEFYTNGKRMMSMGRLGVLIRAIGHRLFPAVMEKLGVDLIDDEQRSYFSSLIMTAVRERAEKGIVRLDMINQLMQARDSLTDVEMVAQCFNFLAAGLDTVSTCLQFLSYELAINPEVQQKLYEEVIATHGGLGGGSLTYDALQKMKYLDMVVSEALRKWPPAPTVDRLCVKDYQLDDEDGLRFTIEKDATIWLPIHALHHDPKYFPEPEKFDPERFCEDRKETIKAGTYLPFGIGPRNCIGMRLALTKVKTIIYYVVLNFALEPTGRTEVPLVLAKGMNVVPEILTQNGVFLRFRPRKPIDSVSF